MPDDAPPILDPQPMAQFDALQPGLGRQMLETFTADLIGAVATLEGQLARGERRQAGDLAHRLKGAAGTIGARQLAAAARALQEACRDPAAPPLEAVWQSFRAAVERWRAHVQGLGIAAGC